MKSFFLGSLRSVLAASVVVALGLLPSSEGRAQQRSLLEYPSIHSPRVDLDGMVVSQNEAASAVGARVLAEGGNAIDAAVAVGFALAVTLPRAGNLGGGGFMVIHLSEGNRSIAIDHRESAPASARANMFLDANGRADPRLSRDTGLSVGVPGTVAGLIHAHER
ncbi:MAG: gamma-glutamyltransferase, partial [Proteobacteria bacterium]|nr:gamma-glutamyltransferase [Pseudomonadota bacterium]